MVEGLTEDPVWADEWHEANFVDERHQGRGSEMCALDRPARRMIVNGPH